MVAARVIHGGLIGLSLALSGCAGLWSHRNLGVHVGSDSFYPDYQTTGGYYTPSYKHGGPRCFGYTPAFMPGCYPGVYDGYDHFRKGPSGCDINAPDGK